MERTNGQWLQELSSEHPDEAIDTLRRTLLTGLRYSLSNRISRDDFDALIEDFVQDAILKILDNLHTFRGESKFTTWAQKIAVRVAYSELRKQRWKNTTIEDILPDTDSDFVPMVLSDKNPNPDSKTTQNAMLNIVMRLIEEELTEKQRTAMQAIIIGNMPIEEVARRMDTNTNALYKVLHDARKNLKQKLADEGLTPEGVLSTFDAP